MRSLLVELYLYKFPDFAGRVSLANKIIYLFYACTPTNISSRLFIFVYFLHTFPITLKLDVEMFAICTQNYFCLLLLNCNYRQVLSFLFNHPNKIIFEHLY
jgi:hypothetical protein